MVAQLEERRKNTGLQTPCLVRGRCTSVGNTTQAMRAIASSSMSECRLIKSRLEIALGGHLLRRKQDGVNGHLSPIHSRERRHLLLYIHHHQVHVLGLAYLGKPETKQASGTKARAPRLDSHANPTCRSWVPRTIINSNCKVSSSPRPAG